VRLNCAKEVEDSDLNKVAGEFFNDNVSNKTFVHDEIHQVWLPNPPNVTYYKKDGEPRLS